MPGPGDETIRRLVKKQFSRLVVAMALSLAVIFAISELVRVTFLAGADEHIVHDLALLRGVLAAVVAAALIGRYLLQATPPLPLRAPAAAAELVPLTRVERDSRRIDSCARWFVQMRWLAILAAATLAVLGVQVLHLLPHRVLTPLLLTVVALTVFNVVVRRLVRSEAVTTRQLNMQVYADLIALNVLLHFSGGVENPLYILAVFHVMIAGILLSPLQCYSVAASAGLLFSLLLLLEWSDLLPHYTLQIVPHGHGREIHAAHDGEYVVSVAGTLWGALLLLAFFVTRLSGQIRADEEELEAFADHAISERNLLENALATTETAIRRLDTQLVPRWTNDQWTAWFDSSRDLGDAAALQDAREGALQGAVRTTEISVPANGAEVALEGMRFFRITTAPLRDSAGRISEIVELAQEVTQQKLEQARLIRTEQLAAVGELASNIAHEVNNPIAIMGGKARLLLSRFGGQVPDTVQRDLDRIVELSDRVAGIAKGLLSYARPSPGARKPLAIREPVERALQLAKQKPGLGPIRWSVRINEALPLVQANPQELEQVFLNLLLNALDAMPEGGELGVVVEICPDGGAEHVCVTVSDTGPGIPDDVQERIFEPFFSTKPEGRGTGLGLSICHGLVKSHGGKIELSSRLGEGARFTVRLPATASGSGDGGEFEG